MDKNEAAEGTVFGMEAIRIALGYGGEEKRGEETGK